MIPFHKQERPRVDRGRNKEEKRPISLPAPHMRKSRLRNLWIITAGVIGNRATAGWARRKSKWDFITTTGSLVLFKVFYLNFLFTILFLAVLDHHIDLFALDVSHRFEEFFFISDRIRPGQCLEELV